MQLPRLWFLVRIALVSAGLIILFFSGLAPLEDYLALVPKASTISGSLSASVVAADVAVLTNQNREQNGLHALSVNPLLTQAAQMKADDMAGNSYYAHVSPDGKSPLYWFQKAGYKYLNAGENLVIDRDTSEEAVAAWMNSEAHRENILRPQFTEIGIGVAQGRYKGQDTIYVVQEFGTPYPLSEPKLATIPKKLLPVEVSKAVATAKPAIQSVALVPPTSNVVAQVNAMAAPIVHALTPAIKKAIAPQVLPLPTATSTAKLEKNGYAGAPGSMGSSSIATSSFSYALPPEFFAPVSYAPLYQGSSTIQRQRSVAGEEGSRVASTGPALPASQIARPDILASFVPALKATFSHITASLQILLR